MFKSKKKKQEEELQKKLIKKCKSLNVDVINKRTGKLLSISTLKSRCGGDTYFRKINEIAEPDSSGTASKNKIKRKRIVMNADIGTSKWVKKQKQKFKEDKSNSVYFTPAPKIEIYRNEITIEKDNVRKSSKSSSSSIKEPELKKDNVRKSIKESELKKDNVKKRRPIINIHPDVVTERIDKNVPVYIDEYDRAYYGDGFSTLKYKNNQGRYKRRTNEERKRDQEIKMLQRQEKEEEERERLEKLEKDKFIKDKAEEAKD